LGKGYEASLVVAQKVRCERTKTNDILLYPNRHPCL